MSDVAKIIFEAVVDRLTSLGVADTSRRVNRMLIARSAFTVECWRMGIFLDALAIR